MSALHLRSPFERPDRAPLDVRWLVRWSISTSLLLGFPMVAALFTGCASTQPPIPAPLPARVDTVFVPCPAMMCPPLKCPPPPDPRLARVGRDADRDLWIGLDSTADVDFVEQGGVLGAMVLRTRDSLVLWSHQPDTRLLPASTQKLWTVGAGLSELGPDFRWRTTLWAKGRIENGVLHGNLILEGGGDPTLGTGEGPGMQSLANALSKLRVREVRGNLVALDTMVGRGADAWPQGWTILSSRDGYGSPIFGLNWNQNRLGDRALPEPRPEALKALRKALLSKTISVTGTDTTVKARGDTIGPRKEWTKIGTVPSASLDEVSRVCLRESVNSFAEGIFLALGIGKGKMSVRDAGRKRLQEWVFRQGFEPWKMVLDDGCGLSRYDMVTARQMAKLMSRDLHGEPGARLVDFMARGGEGTLRRRFKELPDPSVVVAKTGTLDGVTNLVGVMARPGKDTLAFAFLCSGFTGSPKPVRKFQDRLLAQLAGVALKPMVPADTADSVAQRDPPKKVLADSAILKSCSKDSLPQKGAVDSLPVRPSEGKELPAGDTSKAFVNFHKTSPQLPSIDSASGQRPSTSPDSVKSALKPIDPKSWPVGVPADSTKPKMAP